MIDRRDLTAAIDSVNSEYLDELLLCIADDGSPGDTVLELVRLVVNQELRIMALEKRIRE